MFQRKVINILLHLMKIHASAKNRRIPIKNVFLIFEDFFPLLPFAGKDIIKNSKLEFKRDSIFLSCSLLGFHPRISMLMKFISGSGNELEIFRRKSIKFLAWLSSKQSHIINVKMPQWTYEITKVRLRRPQSAVERHAQLA